MLPVFFGEEGGGCVESTPSDCSVNLPLEGASEVTCVCNVLGSLHFHLTGLMAAPLNRHHSYWLMGLRVQPDGTLPPARDTMSHSRA